MSLYHRSKSFFAVGRSVAKAIRTKSFVQPQIDQTQLQKLDYLADVVSKLSRFEMKYLHWLIDQKTLQSGGALWEQKVDMSLVEDSIDPRSYFLQKETVDKNWPSRFAFMQYMLGDAKIEEIVETKVETKAKQIYDVQLLAVSAADKIKIIKAIRETMNLGLKEAKELVEKTPVVLKQAKKDEADALAEKLTKAGCNVAVK